jgi:prefoldin subunit 5
MEKPAFELLSQWQSYLTNISDNLMELSEQTEYEIIELRAKDAAHGYTGITKVKAAQCVESVGALWRYFALLTEVFEKANNLYSKNSFLNNTEDDVRELLDSAAIVIETEPIAINDRNLISSENNEKKTTPGELLKYMQESFESVCSTVTEISKAAETVDSRLDNIKKDIDKLNSAAKCLGIANIPIFNIEKVAEIESNPLQGSMELDKLVYSIEKYRASIKSIEGDYNNIVDTLSRVRGMLFELKDLALKSKEAIERSQKVFGNKQTIKPVIDDNILKSFEDWLQVLERKLSEGHLNAVKIGVCKLEEECSLKLKLERENYYDSTKDYNDLLDLKGQFKALCAKAEALTAKGLIKDGSINEQINNTKAALYENVIDLNKCKQLVGKFELTLKK